MAPSMRNWGRVAVGAAAAPVGIAVGALDILGCDWFYEARVRASNKKTPKSIPSATADACRV